MFFPVELNSIGLISSYRRKSWQSIISLDSLYFVIPHNLLKQTYHVRLYFGVKSVKPVKSIFNYQVALIVNCFPMRLLSNDNASLSIVRRRKAVFKPCMHLYIIILGYCYYLGQRIPSSKFLLLLNSNQILHDGTRIYSPCVVVNYNKNCIQACLLALNYSLFNVLFTIESIACYISNPSPSDSLLIYWEYLMSKQANLLSQLNICRTIEEEGQIFKSLMHFQEIITYFSLVDQFCQWKIAYPKFVVDLQELIFILLHTFYYLLSRLSIKGFQIIQDRDKLLNITFLSFQNYLLNEQQSPISLLLVNATQNAFRYAQAIRSIETFQQIYDLIFAGQG